MTLGTPIGLLVRNKDQRPHDYTETDHYPRPSHADWTYLLKYGLKASSGGGRSSARETIGKSSVTKVGYARVNETDFQLLFFPPLKQVVSQLELSQNVTSDSLTV